MRPGVDHGWQRGPLVRGRLIHLGSPGSPGVTSQGIDVPLVVDGGDEAPHTGHRGHLCPLATGEVEGV